MSGSSRSGWRQPTVLAGAGLMVFFVISLLVAFTVQKGVPGKSYTYAEVAFEDVGSLRVGDDVRLRSVREGQVSAIEVGDEHAIVRLQLPADMTLHRDATATIRARSALGQAYVDLQPGSESAGDLGNDVLGLSQTRSQVQLDSLLDVFDERTRAAGAAAAREAGLGAARHGQDLNSFLSTAPDTLADLAEVSDALSSDDADLATTLQAAATLSEHLRASSTELATLIESSNAVLDAFAVDDTDPLRRTLRAAPSTLSDARSALDALQQPVESATSAVRALRPGLDDLGRQTSSLRQALVSGTTTLDQVPPVAESALPAVTSLTGTASDLRPLSVQLSSTFDRARPFTAGIGDYGTNAGLFFEWFADALSQSLPNGDHYLRLDLVTGPSAIAGTIPGPSPLTPNNPYPGPREAYNEGGR
ncbi:MlaD family protein [Nocardioides sp.]|uniref:MlaD family protein n=1 Tax=Nocardioides sp. TaxID=35761 RepID=UPI003515BBD0